MSRLVLGNRGSVLALTQARAVLSELNAEWPDVHIVQKTIQPEQRREVAGDGAALLAALQAGKINVALLALEYLPDSLPDGLELSAVTKRLEPRQALLAKGQKSLSELAAGANVGVTTARDGAFLKAACHEVKTHNLSGSLDDDLSLLTSGELDALLLPAATLIQLERRQHIDALLEPEIFAPTSGQGSLGLIVNEGDYAAQDLAYTLQHRPSFDRVRAERSFAAALKGLEGYAVGALATVSVDGELNLFGALTDMEGALLMQAEMSGEASEASDLGKELAQDMLEQLEHR